MTLACDGDFTRAGPARVFGGIEVLVLQGLILRGGGHSGLNSQPGFSVGAGLVLNHGVSGRPRISFDYALVDEGTLGYANEGSLTVRFGQPKQPQAKGEDLPEPELEPSRRSARRAWRDLEPSRPASQSPAGQRPPSDDVLHDLLEPPGP